MSIINKFTQHQIYWKKRKSVKRGYYRNDTRFISKMAKFQRRKNCKRKSAAQHREKVNKAAKLKINNNNGRNEETPEKL